MSTEIPPMLAVTGGNAAVEFYKATFGAEVLWHLGAGGDIVAGLAINGAKFFLADQSPEYGTQGPSSAGFTTVRIELFVDDPVSVQKQAIAAGAKSTVRSRKTGSTWTDLILFGICRRAQLWTRSAICG